jgi:hypothetical protein
MNAAIAPLETESPGQKLSLAGGLQPEVTPVAAIHSISTSKIHVSSSANVPPAAITAAGIAAVSIIGFREKGMSFPPM